MQNLPTTLATVTNKPTTAVVLSDVSLGVVLPSNISTTGVSVTNPSFDATWGEQLQTWANSSMAWALISDKTAVTNL
jgi:hypothetical protein